MALDRGTLAKIDRRVFAELDHIDGVQMVKVPVSDATWSTWRRYCEAMELSMGEGIAALISHELLTTVDTAGPGRAPFSRRVDQLGEERVQHLDARERELATIEKRLQAKEEHLRAREQRSRTLREVSDRVDATTPRAGRNEQCPCGSGVKYKRCHGGPSRSR
jgi:hypothetical protein